MVQGMLIVNLDPPYAAFIADNETRRKELSASELRELLLALSALSPFQKWPLREYILRLNGTFCATTLQRFGLFSTLSDEAGATPDNGIGAAA